MSASIGVVRIGRLSVAAGLSRESRGLVVLKSVMQMLIRCSTVLSSRRGKIGLGDRDQKRCLGGKNGENNGVF